MRSLRLLCATTIFGAVLVCGCSKTGTKSSADVYDGTITEWQVNTPNPLLAFVPSDAAAVIATQRKRDIHSNGMMEYLLAIKEVFKHDIPREFRSLFANYEAEAPTWGLDSNGHFDAVAYLHNKKVVFHITVADEQKMLDHINSLLGDDDDEFKNIDNWKVYTDSDSDYPQNSDSIAFNIKNNVLTVVIENGEIKSAPEVKVVQKNPFIPKVTEKDTILVAELNYNNLINFITATPAIVSEIDDDFASEIYYSRSNPKYDDEEAETNARGDSDNYESNRATEWLKKHGYTSAGDDVCVNDFKSLVADFSTSNVYLTLSDNGAAGFKLNISIASTELLNDLKSLITEHSDLDVADAKVKGHLSVSMDKLVKFANKTINTPREWKCKQVEYIVKEFIDDIEVDTIENDHDYQDYIKTFESISFVLPTIPKTKRYGFEMPDLLAHMRHSAESYHKIAAEVDVEYSENTPFSVPIDDKNYNFLISGNDAYMGSESFDLTKKYKMKKDDFFDITVQKGVLYSFLKDDVPAQFLHNYHINLTLDGNDLSFSILPYTIENQ